MFYWIVFESNKVCQNYFIIVQRFNCNKILHILEDNMKFRNLCF